MLPPPRGPINQVNPRGHLRHPLFADMEIAPLLDALRDGNAADVDGEPR